MEPITCIIFTNSSITISSGVVSKEDSKPIITTFKNKLFNSMYRKDGTFSDIDLIREKLAEMINEQRSLGVSFQRVFVSIPDTGVICQGNKTEVYTSHDSIITDENLASLIQSARRKDISLDKSVIAIEYNQFITDNSKFSTIPPDDCRTTKLTLDYTIYISEHTLFQQYINMFVDLGISVCKYSINTYEIAKYLSLNGVNHSAYFLIDTSLTNTNVSIVQNKIPFLFVSVDFGTLKFYEQLSEKFEGVSLNEAKMIFLNFGYDPETYAYKFDIFNKTDEEGNKLAINQKQLNSIIEANANIYSSEIKTALKRIGNQAKIPEDINLPIVSIGNMRDIMYVDKYIKSKGLDIEVYFSGKPNLNKPEEFITYGLIKTSKENIRLNYDYKNDSSDKRKGITRGE